MQDFVTEKHENSTQSAMLKLEKIELEIKQINRNAFVKIHAVEDSEMKEEFEEPEGDGFWPFINVLKDGHKAYILYTYQATFLDGYLPHESKPTSHLIPDNIIESTRPSVVRQVGVGLFNEEEPDPSSDSPVAVYANNIAKYDPKIAELERQIKQIKEKPKVVVSSPVESSPSPVQHKPKPKPKPKHDEFAVEKPRLPLPPPEPKKPKRKEK